MTLAHSYRTTGATGDTMGEETGTMVKLAWKPDNSVPAGQPAPGRFDCPCGSKIEGVAFGGPEVHTCPGCGSGYDSRGWALPSVAVSDAAPPAEWVRAAAEAIHPHRVNGPERPASDGCGCQEADEHEFYMRGDEELARIALSAVMPQIRPVVPPIRAAGFDALEKVLEKVLVLAQEFDTEDGVDATALDRPRTRGDRIRAAISAAISAEIGARP